MKSKVLHTVWCIFSGVRLKVEIDHSWEWKRSHLVYRLQFKLVDPVEGGVGGALLDLFVRSSPGIVERRRRASPAFGRTFTRTTSCQSTCTGPISWPRPVMTATWKYGAWKLVTCFAFWTPMIMAPLRVINRSFLWNWKSASPEITQVRARLSAAGRSTTVNSQLLGHFAKIIPIIFYQLRNAIIYNSRCFHASGQSGNLHLVNIGNREKIGGGGGGESRVCELPV